MRRSTMERPRQERYRNKWTSRRNPNASMLAAHQRVYPPAVTCISRAVCVLVNNYATQVVDRRRGTIIRLLWHQQQPEKSPFKGAAGRRKQGAQ